MGINSKALAKALAEDMVQPRAGSANLVDTIKAQIKGSVPHYVNEESLRIEQELNKLFYLPPLPNREAKFVNMVLKKNGYDAERVGLHGSAIIKGEKDFCYREQVLSLFYKQAQGENVPVNLKRIFEEGNAIHEKWQRLFIRGGLCDPDNLDRSRFNKKYSLSYTPDGAPVTLFGDEYVVEIKSVNTYQFKHLKSHPSGKKQLFLYMWLTGIHKGFVLCDDKNTQEFKVFAYDFDKDLILPFKQRLEAINQYKQEFVEERKMVKGICSKSTCKKAMDCNMRDACFNVGMGRIKLSA